MSLFGAMTTAVSGLSAQSVAFGNISDNVANSQTVGFKGVDTNFTDYLTQSTAQVNDPGSVVTTPDYTTRYKAQSHRALTHSHLRSQGKDSSRFQSKPVARPPASQSSLTKPIIRAPAILRWIRTATW